MGFYNFDGLEFSLVDPHFCACWDRAALLVNAFIRAQPDPCSDEVQKEADLQFHKLLRGMLISPTDPQDAPSYSSSWATPSRISSRL